MTPQLLVGQFWYPLWHRDNVTVLKFSTRLAVMDNTQLICYIGCEIDSPLVNWENLHHEMHQDGRSHLTIKCILGWKNFCKTVARLGVRI